jgi:hypothetical protein
VEEQLNLGIYEGRAAVWAAPTGRLVRFSLVR